MFVVYRQPYGCARLPMGHYKGEKAALEYAAKVRDAHPGQSIAVVEEADNGRDVFCDVKPAAPVAGAAPVAEISVERAATKGGK